MYNRRDGQFFFAKSQLFSISFLIACKTATCEYKKKRPLESFY
jgi:hypothetical protein